MDTETRLSSLREGESCIIAELLASGRLRSRLRGLGFIEGARAECLHRSASGDLAAYLVCGAVIALRRRDADDIIIRNAEFGMRN